VDEGYLHEALADEQGLGTIIIFIYEGDVSHQVAAAAVLRALEHDKDEADGATSAAAGAGAGAPSAAAPAAPRHSQRR
jgi:hypothetical protein